MGVFGIGVLRLPASGTSTFGLDEHRARLVDTGGVCGGATLPGLIPESTAYLSSGDIVSAGPLRTTAASPPATISTMMAVHPVEEDVDHDDDTPQNPSGKL